MDLFRSTATSKSVTRRERRSGWPAGRPSSSAAAANPRTNRFAMDRTIASVFPTR